MSDRAPTSEALDSVPWDTLEELLHRDPARRNLAGYRNRQGALDAGQLRAATAHLARHARAVAIVTGFCAIVNDRVTAETDGPPGALFLARALLDCGIEVALLTDRYALPLLLAGCEAWNLDRNIVLEFPCEENLASAPKRSDDESGQTPCADRWIESFLASDFARRLTHVVAIERPGPSHTPDSLRNQPDAQPHATDAARQRFLREVPREAWNVCHNMRGQSIDAWTAKTHRLFEWISEHRLPITTIGIGDGGNEIGMGRFAWEELTAAAGGNAAGRIACRIATDFSLICGVSDWGGYALGLAIGKLRGPGGVGDDWTAAGQRELIRTLVEQAGAVDGLTLRREATVDGLPLAEYLEPFAAMRRALAYRGA